MRIGLFGGTFNPIHLGHLRAAKEVKAAFALDTTFIIPSAIPPHKGNLDLVTANQRLEMIRLAVSDHRDLVVSDIELKRSGPSYTIDTVNHFKSIYSEDTRLYLIMGLDAFLEIDTWKSYDKLLQRIPFILMERPDAKWTDSTPLRQILEEFLKSRISKSYVFSASRSGFFHSRKQPILITSLNLLDISSSTIRKFIKAGKSIQLLVPEKVEDYIKSKGLYL
jgi:nicotinate-nucleotide adenylyltransferase